MTATVIPLHRGGTQDLNLEVVQRAHQLWEAFDKVKPEDRAYHRVWLEAMFALGDSFDESVAAKECRDDAIKDLDDHKGDEPA